MTVVVVLFALWALVILALVLFTASTARRVEAALPPLGEFLEVDGARIQYVDRGRGPTILMIHGLGGQLRHFTHSLVARLERDFRVVVMERPGAGHSTRAPGSSAAPRAQAATVARFIRALGLERPLVVGHSLGGAVALALATEHPELVGGLALVAPLTQVEDEVPSVFRTLYIESAALRWLIAWTLATPAALLRRKAALDMIFGPEAVPPDYALAGGGMLSLRPRSFVSAATDLVAVRADMPALVERYASLRVPVGILFGTGDRILDHEVHGVAMRARVPNLRLELVAGGHMLPVTMPDRVAAFVRDIAQWAGIGAPVAGAAGAAGADAATG